jgi:hypothetical protein
MRRRVKPDEVGWEVDEESYAVPGEGGFFRVRDGEYFPNFFQDWRKSLGELEQNLVYS